EAVPRISDQMKIDIYANGEFVREVTLGMKKFGLPDVTVQETSETSVSQTGNLIDVFTQTLAEGKRIPKSGKFKLDLHLIRNAAFREEQLKSFKENGTGIACLTLKKGKREEGDADNRLLQLAFDEYPGPDSLAELEAALAGFFGWDDSLKYVE